VISLDPIKLVGYVPETEVDRVTVGAPAFARLASGREVQGDITFISRSADSATRTFRVEVEVPNPDLAIRDGQTVEIAVASEGADAHLLPQSALTLNDAGRLGVRIVAEDETAAFAPVAVLRDTVEGIWVDGLGETADVIVVGQEFVIDGVAVAPTFRESLP
jgi:membrane fusion protein, multidrug efflux system